MRNETLAADLQCYGIDAKRTLINTVGPFTVEYNGLCGYGVREHGQILMWFVTLYEMKEWLRENAK